MGYEDLFDYCEDTLFEIMEDYDTEDERLEYLDQLQINNPVAKDFIYEWYDVTFHNANMEKFFDKYNVFDDNDR